MFLDDHGSLGTHSSSLQPQRELLSVVVSLGVASQSPQASPTVPGSVCVTGCNVPGLAVLTLGSWRIMVFWSQILSPCWPQRGFLGIGRSEDADFQSLQASLKFPHDYR